MKFLLIPLLGLCVCVSGQSGVDHCLMKNEAGCELGRAPRYVVMAPRRVRPEQVFQVFITILRIEFYAQAISVQVSVLRDNVEQTNGALRFERPASRILQLRMPPKGLSGKYKLRVEGKLAQGISGNIFFNETDLEFSPKKTSLFIQMDRPIYKQEQLVHFRIIPINPDMMPRSGTMDSIYIEDPTGFAVRRWQAVQPNAGGLVSLSFQLSDQPNYGTWHIRVNAFSHEYRTSFEVEEFWKPRFDVNVTVPAYVMESDGMVIRGVVMANHTSGRACKGSGTITAFFLPSEELWKSMKGWEKPYTDAIAAGNSPSTKPAYIPISNIKATDYHLYFRYIYRVVDYFAGRLDFEWSLQELSSVAKSYGHNGALAGNEFVFFVNVTDWYFRLNRTGWAGTEIFSDKIQLKWVGGNVRTFKPGSKMKVQVAASFYDGTPVRSGTISLSQIQGDKSDKSDSNRQSVLVTDGIAIFDVNVGVAWDQFVLTATYNNRASKNNYGMKIDPKLTSSQSTKLRMIGNKYFSPTNSYISISTSTWHPKVDQYMIFHVVTSQFVPRIYYQVIAQGNIIIGDELEMTSRQKTFAISLSREMIPMARILVYYIRVPEEIVSDVLSFFVNGTRHNQVKLAVNRGKDFTRDTMELNAYADPGSYVAFSGMILDLYIKGLSDGITENKLIDELMTYDEPANSSYRQLWRVSETEYEYKFFHGYDSGIDGNTTFHSAGLLILTDAEVTRLPNVDACAKEQGMFPCFNWIESECFSLAQRCNGVYDGCPNDGADEWGCEEEQIQRASRHSLSRTNRVMRYYDNSSWAWQEIFVKPDGRVDFRVDVPKYPLTWMINGLSLSRDLGLGLMTRPVRLEATRYMYIQVEHPDIIVMGEQIGIRVSVFNYWYEDDYIEVLVTMHAGDDSAFVAVGSMGASSSYSPKTHKGDHQTILFLEPGESQDIYMPIVPDKDLDVMRGVMDFRVTATCFMEKDEYVGTMKVKPNGVMNYYHTPYLIDLVRSPSVDIPSFKVKVAEQFRKPEIRENIYVPQSPMAMSSLFGDVMVPGFFEDYLNAENLLHRPYGSAEQVTFNFAYNMLTVRYMWQSQQLKSDTVKTVLENLNPVLQRILGYMNPDGSFNMFRDDEKPSLWLTAFVGQTLSKAVFGQWEKQLFIPRNLIIKLISYICTRQDPDTGAFLPEDGEIPYDRKFVSLKEMNNGTLRIHKIPLTAYVLIALYEMTDLANGAPGCLEPAKAKAAVYLSGEIYKLGPDEMFFYAISYYALTYTRQNSGTFSRLWDTRRNDSSYTYFADSRVYPNPISQINLQSYLLPRQELMNEGYAVQTTSYVLKALIKSGRNIKTDREALMKWLNTMRNSVGGFASTQDTIVAMEALFEFTKKDPNRNEFELDVILSASSDSEWSRSIELTKQDFTHLTRAFLPRDRTYGYIDSAAQGAGRGMLQLTTTKNVEYPGYLKRQQHVNNDPNQPLIQFFEIDVQPIKWSGRNQSVMEMTTCVSWMYTEKSVTSGLAVLEIDIPTGYVVMNDSLRNYVRSNMVSNLRRAEYYGRKVVFYFSHLDTSKSCVYFRGDRWFPVANATREYRIRVFDYYEPGMYETQIYTAENLHLLNICMVWGSFQCPYTPYFNSGTITSAGLGVILLVFVCTLAQRLVFLPGIR